MFLAVSRVFRGIMGCSWGVPGLFRGCSGLFRAVPGCSGLFRAVPGCSGGVPGMFQGVPGFTDTQKHSPAARVHPTLLSCSRHFLACLITEQSTVLAFLFVN